METGNFSGLRNGNWKFYGFHSVKRKFLRFTWRKPENFWFPFILEIFQFKQQISRSFHFQNGNFFPEKWKPYLWEGQGWKDFLRLSVVTTFSLHWGVSRISNLIKLTYTKHIFAEYHSFTKYSKQENLSNPNLSRYKIY